MFFRGNVRRNDILAHRATVVKPQFTLRAGEHFDILRQ
jgi:hypothetical protein